MITGSLQIKKQKYYAVLNLTDQNGERKQKWISTGLSVAGHNKRAAQKRLTELIDQYETLPKAAISPEKSLFTDDLEAWVEASEFIYDPITWQGYKNCIETQVLPWFRSNFPKLRLAEVTPEHIQSFSTHLSREGNRKTGGVLAPKSVRNYLTVLSQVFEDAKQKNRINENPCKQVRRPKKAKFKPSFYDEDQMQALFAAIKDEPIKNMIIVTALYGLRRSELLGLKWDSVNFTRKEVTINHVVSKFTSVVEKDDTKTESSRRIYPMPPPIEDIFREELSKRDKNRDIFGDKYIETDYVFTWDNGKPYTPDYLTRKFSSLLEKYGLQKIRFHDLRHSCASILLEKGYNLKDVQAWLGHADISTTGNIYGHLTSKHLSAVGADLCTTLL